MTKEVGLLQEAMCYIAGLHELQTGVQYCSLVKLLEKIIVNLARSRESFIM